MRNLFVLTVLQLLTFFGGCVFAQENNPRIEALGYSDGKVLQLRWGPTQAVAWNLLNNYGYTIERHTVAKRGTPLKPIIKEVLDQQIKPRALDNWETEASSNDYAAVAAEAIYGETFSANTGEGSNTLLTMINKSREQDQRFSFAMFAADQSWEVAKLAGLGFTDSTAVPNEKYLYKIYSTVPSEILSIDTGYFFIGLADTAALPIPQNFLANFKDKTVELSWDVEDLRFIYNGYIIERSVNNIDFLPISNTPFVLAGSYNKNGRLVSTDSLPVSGMDVFYRIKGRTAFGIEGSPSKVIKGKSIPKFNLIPQIVRGNSLSDGSVLLEWTNQGEFPGEFHYILERSEVENGLYEKVSEETISASQLSYYDTDPQLINYYRIKAVAETGQSSTSYPFMVQIEDSIPPASPQFIKGMADSLGNVSIEWQENIEKDLAGYRVFRSNSKDHEFSQITNEALKNPVYNDLVTLSSIQKHIYYYVTAVDVRNNQSSPSEVLQIDIPDQVAPVPPVIVGFNSTSSGIELMWKNSTSNDVTKHIIKRKLAGEGTWDVVHQVKMAESLQGTWVDSTMTESGRYEYAVVASDSSNNLSRDKKPTTIDCLFKQKDDQALGLNTVVDRKNKKITLSWNLESSDHDYTIVYRSVNQGALTLLKRVLSDVQHIDDYNVESNNDYNYSIKIVDKQSEKNQMVLSKTVNY